MTFRGNGTFLPQQKTVLNSIDINVRNNIDIK